MCWFSHHVCTVVMKCETLVGRPHSNTQRVKKSYPMFKMWDDGTSWPWTDTVVTAAVAIIPTGIHRRIHTSCCFNVTWQQLLYFASFRNDKIGFNTQISIFNTRTDSTWILVSVSLSSWMTASHCWDWSNISATVCMHLFKARCVLLCVVAYFTALGSLGNYDHCNRSMTLVIFPL